MDYNVSINAGGVGMCCSGRGGGGWGGCRAGWDVVIDVLYRDLFKVIVTLLRAIFN